MRNKKAKGLIAFMLVAVFVFSTVFHANMSKASETEGVKQYTPTSNQYRNVMYYGDWSIWEGEDNFYPSDLPADQLTHLNFAFMDFDANGNLIFCDKDAALEADLGVKSVEWGAVNGGLLSSFQELRTKNPNLRIGVSFGGWSKSGDFSKMAANASSRKNFVESVMKYIKYTNMDFVDIDWEYPGANQVRLPDKVDNQNDEGTPYACAEDKANYIILLQDLRDALDKQGKELSKTYELSVALPAAPSKLDDGIDIKKLFNIVDFANIMTYDLRGAWDSTSGHQTNLYTNPNDSYGEDAFSVDSTVKYLLQNGAIANKMVIGCAFYTRGWEKVSAGTDPSLPGLFGEAELCAKNADQSLTYGAANESPLKVGDGGRRGGSWSYRSLDKLKAAYPGLKEYWDDTAKASYLYDPVGGAFFTYDSPRAIKEKADYVKANNLGGMISWMASQDKPTTSTKRDELTKVIKEALFGTAPLNKYAISDCQISASATVSTYKEQWGEGTGYTIVVKNNSTKNESNGVLSALETACETIKLPKLYIHTKSGATFTSGGYESGDVTNQNGIGIVDLGSSYETKFINIGTSCKFQVISSETADLNDIVSIELAQRVTEDGPEISRITIYGEEVQPTETPVVTETPVTGDTYDNTKVYNAREQVIYKGVTYEARWWTQGVAPDSDNEWGVWKKISSSVTPTVAPTEKPTETTTPGGTDTYISTQVYTGGDTVVYNGVTFKAKWWTQGVTPSIENVWGPWEVVK